MSDREDRIRERAFHLWEQAGRPDGRSHEFWVQAEREEAASASGPATKAKTATTKPASAKEKKTSKKEKATSQKPSLPNGDAGPRVDTAAKSKPGKAVAPKAKAAAQKAAAKPKNAAKPKK